MLWLCVFFLVTTSPRRIDRHSSRARANADILHKDLFAQRALFDVATPTSPVVQPNDSDKWVSLVAVVTSAEDTQRHVIEKQHVWVGARSRCPPGRGRNFLHLPLERRGESEPFQKRQLLDGMVFSEGWVPGAWLSRTEWLTVRSIAPLEGRILSLFIILQRTRAENNKPFQCRYVLQELIFIDDGAAQSWLPKSEWLAARATAVCEHHLLLPFRIFVRTWETETMWRR